MCINRSLVSSGRVSNHEKRMEKRMDGVRTRAVCVSGKYRTHPRTARSIHPSIQPAPLVIYKGRRPLSLHAPSALAEDRSRLMEEVESKINSQAVNCSLNQQSAI